MENFPKYAKSNFYCPISHYVLWHHGLMFKECPLCQSERNTDMCNNCCLKGESVNKKQTSKNRKSNKDNIPKIGKTYLSE